MTDGLVLSIDGMGGDHAPDIVVEGVDVVAKRGNDVRFLLHGDAARLAALLDRHPAAKAVTEVVAAEKAIGMEVKPSQALAFSDQQRIPSAQLPIASCTSATASVKMWKEPAPPAFTPFAFGAAVLKRRTISARSSTRWTGSKSKLWKARAALALRRRNYINPRLPRCSLINSSNAAR